MKAIKILALGVAATALLFTACKKKEETKTEETKTPLSTYLVGKDWRVIGKIRSVDGAPPLDIFASFKDCEKDDLREFVAAGNVVDKPGATKCDSGEPDSEIAGKWSIINNETQLRIINGDTVTMNIKELTATSLKVDLIETDMGATYTTSTTYTKN